MSAQNKIFLPTENAQSWRRFLADKDKHWKQGFSAMSAAYSWENSDGLPKEIIEILSQHSNFKGHYPQFLFYVIKRMDFRQYYASTTVPILNRDDIHRIKIALHKDNTEQVLIANKIDE
jgi:restriction endonuclease S subunit